jgi:hypothetical protein
MADPAPDPAAHPAPPALAEAVLHAWAAFFARFRPDEQEFERHAFLEEAAAINAHLAELPPGTLPGTMKLFEMLATLDRYAERRFAEQNQRIDELMDLCEQMRQRLEASDLTRSHLEDEFGHCMAIVQSALERLKLAQPEGLPHPPRLHNLFNHVLTHFQPEAGRMDTMTYQRIRPQVTPKPEDPPALFDYDRLARLFRRGEGRPGGGATKKD